MHNPTHEEVAFVEKIFDKILPDASKLIVREAREVLSNREPKKTKIISLVRKIAQRKVAPYLYDKNCGVHYGKEGTLVYDARRIYDNLQYVIESRVESYIENTHEISSARKHLVIRALVDELKWAIIKKI